MTEATGGPTSTHFRNVARAILRGDVVPVLGAGANRCDRLPGESYELGRRLPDGGELADLLADTFEYEGSDRRDLVRVSQAAVLTMGDGPVFKELRRVFTGAYEPTSLHSFLAAIPQLMRDRGLPARPQLIVTTNYDTLVERALEAAGEPYDLVYYLGQDGQHPGDRGKFVHISPEGRRRVVRVPKKYVELTPDTRTVVLKVHGAVREDPAQDSWVLTEDHYIDYLTRTNLSELIPVNLLARLVNSHFLFLGYALKDWNLRVMLHRIWSQRSHGWESWAVQLHPDPLDEAFWGERHVDIHDMALHDYVAELRSCLESPDLKA